MPRDLFEEYKIKQSPSKREKNNTDLFKQANIYQPKESKGFGGILSDAYHKTLDTITGLPHQLMQLPSEVYGAGKQIVTHPKRALQNVGAGFGELGHGILSAPANVRDYLEKKDIVSHNAPSLRLPESIVPKDYNYAEALGAQGEEKGDSLLRGIPKAAAFSPLAELTPYASSAIAKGVSKLKPENPYHYIQKAYDAKERSLSNMFSHVSNEAKEAGIEIKLPKKLLGEIKKAGPKTEAFNNLLKKAKTGDYDSLRSLQTELFQRGKEFKSSLLPSDRDFGAHLFEKREHLNNAIINALEKEGRTDLAGKLNKAKEGWLKLQNTYHSNPVISKLVGKEREVASTYNPLKKESTSINRLKEELPQIEKTLNRIRRTKQAGGALSALGIAGGLKSLYQGRKD